MFEVGTSAGSPQRLLCLMPAGSNVPVALAATPLHHQKHTATHPAQLLRHFLRVTLQLIFDCCWLYTKSTQSTSWCIWPTNRTGHHHPVLVLYCCPLRLLQETLYQKSAGGVQFVDILKQQGIVPGIKVDTGLQVRPTAAAAAAAVFVQFQKHAGGTWHHRCCRGVGTCLPSK
jgi:hypothetical protein